MLNISRLLGGGGEHSSLDRDIGQLEMQAEAELQQESDEVRALADDAHALRVEASKEAGHGECEVEIEYEIEELRTTIEGSAREKYARRDAKEAFRKLHGLPHDCRPGNALLAVMVAFIMVGLESLVNASFLQTAYLTASPTEAYIVAFTLSATNILLGTIAGYVAGRRLHYGLNSPEPEFPEFVRVRKTARIVLAGYIAAMVLILLTAGLLRAQETLAQVEHSFTAFIELIASPEALWLVSIAACFAWLAFQSGKKAFDDPYYGYGDYQRQLDELDDQLAVAHEDAKTKVDQIFKDARTSHAKALSEQHGLARKYNHAVKKCKDRYRKLTSSVRNAESRLALERAKAAEARASVRGRPKAAKGEPQCPANFQRFLDISLPQEMALHTAAAFEAHLTKVRAEAYRELSALQKLIINDTQVED